MLFSGPDFGEHKQRSTKHSKFFSKIQEKIRFHQRKKFWTQKMSFTLPFEPIQIIFTIVNMSHHENLKISNRYISKNISATYCNNFISSMSTTRETFWTKI